MKITREAVVQWIFSVASAIWLNIPTAVAVLGGLMALDFASGLLRAFIKSNVSSAESKFGMARKAQMLILLGAVGLFTKLGDVSQVTAFGVTVAPLSVVAIGFSFTEFFSIVENVGQSGVKLPAQLEKWMKRFEKLRVEEEADA